MIVIGNYKRSIIAGLVLTANIEELARIITYDNFFYSIAWVYAHLKYTSCVYFESIMALSLTSLVPTSHADIGNPALSQDPNLRRVVVITCLLSLLGSMLIISIYCCCRSLRTRSKLLLVQLSVMTTGLATANLIGVLVNFDQYYYTGRYTNGTPEQRVPNVAIRMACDLESFFAVYFTSGSIMWTIGLAVFLYLRIVHYKTSASTYAQWVMTVWCYTLPMVLSLWKILSMRLGYSRSPFATEGWCGEKMTGLQTQGGDTYFITAFIGYDLWMYLAFILVPTLCVSIQLYIKQEVSWHACKSVQVQQLNNVSLPDASIPGGS